MPVSIIPTTTAPDGTGTTRRRYRRLLAEELGRWIETTVTTEATVGERTRIVLASDLRDDEVLTPYAWPADTWLYVQATDDAPEEQRRVISQPEVGWQGSEGAVILSRPLDAALEVGRVIEATSPLPCADENGIKGLDTLVDEGLRCCRIRALLSFTGNGGYAYSLADYPWLFDVGQTGGIYDAAYLIVSDPPMRNPSSTYRIESDGVARRLVTEGRSYAADETFFVEAFVRADRLVYDADTGVWGYPSTPGLAGDLWQAAAPEHWVLAFSMVKALDYLMRLTRARRDLDKQEKSEYMAEILDRRRVWYRAARRIQIYELPRPPAVRSEPMVGVSNPYGWGDRWL